MALDKNEFWGRVWRPLENFYFWGWKCYDFYTYARPWLNGNVLFKDVYPCPYVVLDTATGVVNKLEFTGEYAWLEGCDDITYIDGDVVCLRQRGDRLCEIDFERDGVVKQSRSFDKNDYAYDYGNRIALLNNKGLVF